MSADPEAGFDGFAAPPFEAETALMQMQRAMRDLKLLARGDGFEQRGKRLVELRVDGGALLAGSVRKPALTPEWDRVRITSVTEQRRWLDNFKRRLALWQRED